MDVILNINFGKSYLIGSLEYLITMVHRLFYTTGFDLKDLEWPLLVF